MSYPGSSGYVTNLACDTSLQRSTAQFLFQLNTGAASGSASTLQSPAAIIPETGGAATLSITNAAGGGDPVLEIRDTTGNNAQLNMYNVGGGNSSIFMGEAPNGVILLAASSSLGHLQIQNGATGSTTVDIDTSNNAVTLTNGGLAGLVRAENPLSIANPAAVGNKLVLAPTSSAQSTINQTVANNGAVGIGSSIATPSILTISDSGANTGGIFIGGNGGNDIFAIGGNGSSIIPNIRTDAANTGQLTVGASVANSQILTIVDGGAANSGYVEISAGNLINKTLRLQGGNTNQPNTLTASVSTGGVSGSGSVLVLTPNIDDGSLPSIKLQGSTGVGNNSIVMNSPLYLNAPASGFGAYVPILLRAPQVSNGTFDVDLSPLPTGISLVYGFSSVSPPSGPDNSYMFSVMVYTNPVDNIVGGGAINSSGRYEILPSLVNGKALIVNLSGTSSANWGIYGITLLGL